MFGFVPFTSVLHQCIFYFAREHRPSPFLVSASMILPSTLLLFFWEYIHGFIDSGSERHMHLVLRLLDAAPSSLAPSSELGENALFVSLFLSLSV